MIQLFTDTSANLPDSLLRQHGIHVLPFTYTVDGQPATHFDGEAFYEAMRQGAVVQTSMINLLNIMEPMRAVLEQGDDVLYIGMSGGISGTAHAAALAAQELRAEFPQRRIATIDTYAASLGEGLQVLQAAEQIAQGAEFDTIVAEIEHDRHTMCQYFTVDDLEYLKRGGRISKVTAVVGTVLKIKPLLMGDETGHIVMCGKARGRRNALVSLAERYDALVADRSADIGIAHADAAADMEALLELLRERGFTGNCLRVLYEPVTGSHVGPGTVALFFRGIHK